MALYALSLAPVTWVLLSEIFPNRIRGAAMSVSTFSLWSACFILTYTFPLLNQGLGPAGTFWIYAGISVFGFIFIKSRVRETKGKTLEADRAGARRALRGPKFRWTNRIPSPRGPGARRRPHPPFPPPGLVKRLYREEGAAWRKHYRTYFKYAARALGLGFVARLRLSSRSGRPRKRRPSNLVVKALEDIRLDGSPLAPGPDPVLSQRPGLVVAVAAGVVPFLFLPILDPLLNGGVLGLLVFGDASTRGSTSPGSS